MRGAAKRPTLSVVVATRNAAATLDRALEALRGSDLDSRAWELIVVDDASDDDTALVAARHADTVVRLTGTAHGSGYARNRGFEAARADIVAFVDPWVIVRPDALRSLLDALDGAPEIAAVVGICDPPGEGGSLVSRYGNLLAAHEAGSRDADADDVFWSGCAAVRRHAFVGVGGFDEWHGPDTATGDLDFTLRMKRSERAIRRCRDARCAHARAWTLAKLLAVGFWRRAFSLAWALPIDAGFQRGGRRRSDALPLMLLGASLTLLSIGWQSGAPAPVALGVVGAAGVLFLDGAFLRFVARSGGPVLAAWAVPAHLIRYVVVGLATMAGWIARALVGPPKPPVTLEALAAVGAPVWPPAPAPPARPDA